MIPSINSNELIQFLERQLKELEDLQGGEEDHEARKKLEEFKAAAAAAPSATQTAPVVMSDEQIMNELDNVEAQLDSVAAALSSMDPAARQLLGASTSTWLQSVPPEVLKESQSNNKAPPASP